MKIRLRYPSAFLFLTCFLFTGPGQQSFAHTPHHVIDVLVASPDYDNDTTLYVVVHNYLLRSSDRGANWHHLVNGIDTPHILTDIALSENFASDDVVFASSDGGGIYKSADRGESWSRFGDGLRHGNVGKLFVAASADGQMVLAAGSSRGLFVSPAQDADWNRVISDDVKVTALAQVSTGKSNYVLAGDSMGGIWKGDGDLRDWRRIVRLNDVGAITSFASGQSRAQTDTLLVGTATAGLLLLSDDGATLESLVRSWPDIVENCRGSEVETPIPDTHVRDIESFANGSRIFVTTWRKAVHVSEDAGVTWQTRDQGLRCDDQADSAAFAMPHYRELEIVGPKQGDWFVASFEGLFRSSDNGRSWVQFETMPVSMIRGMGVSKASGLRHKLVVTTYGGGAYVSEDQGRSWSIRNHGLTSTRLADAEFSPNVWSDSLVFSLSHEHLLVGDNSEGNWSAASLVYRGWRRRVGAGLERHLGFSSRYGKDFFLDDAERHGIWPMQIELSPAFSSDRTMFLGFRRHGIWMSEDGGESWDRSWDGPLDYATDMKISPEFPNDGVVFAAFRGSGVFVTRDSASNWRAASAGLDYFAGFKPTESPNHFVDPPLSRAMTDVVLAISPRYASDLTVFAGSAAGLFRTIDGGRSWQGLSFAMPSLQEAVVGLGISPAYGSDGTVIVSLKGRGLYRSTDAGGTFEPAGANLLRDNVELRYIRFSPSYGTDNIVYGVSEWDLFISRDKGDTWAVIERPVRYEDWRGRYAGPVWFTDGWVRETGADFSASTQTATDLPGAEATLNFVGDSISWFGERGPSGGMARIVVDGVAAGTADLYAGNVSPGSKIFEVSELQDVNHTVVIEVLEGQNPKSTGRRVTVDNFDLPPR